MHAISVGLQCYACISSTNAYDWDCNAGSNKVRYRTCPGGYNYCSVAIYRYEADGTVLRFKCYCVIIFFYNKHFHLIKMSNLGTKRIERECSDGYRTLNEEVESPKRVKSYTTSTTYCHTDFCNGDPQPSTPSSTSASQPSTSSSTSTSKPSTANFTTTYQPSTASYFGKKKKNDVKA